jgi:hypothetical protein
VDVIPSVVLVIARVLPLLLALCTLVPGELWSRFVVACQEPDRCCCRKNDDRAQPGPVAQRVDCCEAPCEAEGTVTPAVAPGRTWLALASVVRIAVEHTEIGDGRIAAPPSQGARGPPLRVHASVERWLI